MTVAITVRFICRLFVVCLAAHLASYYVAAQKETEGTEQQEVGQVIAIADFDGTDAEIARAISQTFTVDLATSSKLRLVERARMAAAQEEIGLGTTGLVDPATAPQLGRAVGANKVIVGSFSFVGSVIQISARMVDVETNTIVGGVAANVTGDIAGRKSDVFGLAHQLASRFHRALTGEDLPSLATGEIPSGAEEAAAKIDPAIAGAFEEIASKIDPLRQVKNSAFKVTVDVDRGYGATYKFGDPLTVTFSSEEDCYLRLYNIDSQRQVNQLFPNRWNRSAFVKAGELHSFPPPGANWKLSLEGAPGEEIILAIATREPTEIADPGKTAEGAQDFIGKSVVPRLAEGERGSWATSEVRFYTEEPKGRMAGKYVYIPVSPSGAAKGIEALVGKGIDTGAVKNYEDGLRAQLLGRPEEAEREFKSALEIEPNFCEAHAALGSVYFAMGLTEEPSEEEGVIEGSLSAAGRVLLGEATKEFQEAMKDNPNYWLGHYNIGVTYFAMGQIEEAIASLNTFLSSNPAGEIAEKAGTLLAELSPTGPPVG